MTGVIGVLPITETSEPNRESKAAIPAGNTRGLRVYPPQPYNLGAEYACPFLSQPVEDNRLNRGFG